MLIRDDRNIIYAPKSYFRNIYKDFLSRLSKQQREELDRFYNLPYELIQLQVIKKQRKPVSTGDVFVYSPKRGIYFYGKVIKADCDFEMKKSLKRNQLNLCFFFRSRSATITMENYEADYDNLLMLPMIIPQLYWRCGYFYNIGNIPLTEQEKNLDTGLLMGIPEGYFAYDLNENPIYHIPKYPFGTGFNTDLAVCIEVNRVLIAEPELLEGFEIKENEPKPLSEFEQSILPFVYIEIMRTGYISLWVESGYPNIFEESKNRGIEGNGYDYEELAKIFIKEKYPELDKEIRFDSEAGRFIAFTGKRKELKEFVVEFKKMLEDTPTAKRMIEKINNIY